MYFLIRLLIITAAVNARVNPDGPTVVMDITNCLTKLIEINFRDPGVLIFANSNHYTTSVSKIQVEMLKKLNDMTIYAIEIKNPQDVDVNICDNYDEQLGVLHKDAFDVRPMPAYFVIIIDHYQEFPLVLGRILRSRSWNPSAKFIILLFDFNKDSALIAFAERMLTCLFRYNATEIIIIVPQENNIRNALVYSWKPIDPPKYCGYFNETAKNRIFVQNTCQKGNLKFNRVFTRALPKNMRGCVVNIIALEKQPFVSRDKEDSNIEKIFVDEIASTYNIKTNYNIVKFNRRGERDHNGKWDGALGRLALKKGQILLGGIFPDFGFHEDFECSSSYLADSYTWIVPRAENSPPWFALWIIFKPEVWYSVITWFIISALSWKFLGQIGRDSLYNKSLKHNFMNAWCCSLGFSCYTRPIRQSLRVFFSFFNIYCILVITAYTTKLIDVLKNPTFEYQLQTVEELINSGLDFGGYQELHDLFEKRTDVYDSAIFERWIVVDDISKAMIDVAVNKNFSVFCSRLELAHLTAVMPELSDDFGNYRYYAFGMNMFSVPVEMIALRGFTFMRMFSHTVELLKQMGVAEALRGRFANFNGRRRAKLLRTLLMEYSDVNALSLRQLQAGFMVLVFGYTGGFIVFLLEVIVSTEWVKSKFHLVKNKLF